MHAWANRKILLGFQRIVQAAHKHKSVLSSRLHVLRLRNGCIFQFSERRSFTACSQVQFSGNKSEENSGTDLIPQTRTFLTKKLWEMRKRRMNENSVGGKGMSGKCNVNEKGVSDSRLCIEVNFSEDESIRSQYENYLGGHIRIGKVFEDLDAFAGSVAAAHVSGLNVVGADDEDKKVSLVTACCDRIDLFQPIPLGGNLVFDGSVTWVGKSSIEISVQILEKETNQRLLLSRFVYIALDRATGKSMVVPRLITKTEEEAALFAAGQEHKNQRLVEAKSSLLREEAPPSPEESKLLHELFIRNHVLKAHGSAKGDASSQIERGINISSSGSGVYDSKTQILMDDTKMKSVVLCQPQERNTNGKIFGGYLMQNAYQLAYNVANVFCGPNASPAFLAVDDISFIRPVEIGHILHFSSKVVYCTGAERHMLQHPTSPSSAEDVPLANKTFQVRVLAKILCVEENETRFSNVFHFTFGSKAIESKKHSGCSIHSSLRSEIPVATELKSVVPQTYVEGMEYLDGRRRWLEWTAIAQKHKEESPYLRTFITRK
eukprot:Nk52_evm11s370 gene=Nk52_evmTU11s370